MTSSVAEFSSLESRHGRFIPLRRFIYGRFRICGSSHVRNRFAPSPSTLVVEYLEEVKKIGSKYP